MSGSIGYYLESQHESVLFKVPANATGVTANYQLAGESVTSALTTTLQANGFYLAAVADHDPDGDFIVSISYSLDGVDGTLSTSFYVRYVTVEQQNADDFFLVA